MFVLAFILFSVYKHKTLIEMINVLYMADGGYLVLTGLDSKNDF